ncbi:hypothetical protein PVAP13_2KG240858 [Panicum virgatum]|uniref:Uncharacterized protein n=1 Tax=Panicum virgatum TaxID=38727 RepID=A0A8T0WEN2_PANVG|nr:hypothetical protein PVAP13_2KG240858 [Panicum virgatum]
MTSRTSTLPPNPDTPNTTTRAPSHAHHSPSSHCTLFCRPVAGHLAVAHRPSTYPQNPRCEGGTPPPNPDTPLLEHARVAHTAPPTAPVAGHIAVAHRAAAAQI